MLRFLHALAALLFFLLAGSFFAAYALLRNAVLTPWAERWLAAADLPLLLSGLLYGGLSVYVSLTSDRQASRILLLAIGLPLLVFFGAVLFFNFWRN